MKDTDRMTATVTRKPRTWKGWAVRDTDPKVGGWSFWHYKEDAEDFLVTWETAKGPLIRVTITEVLK